MCPKWRVCVKSPTELIKGLKGGFIMDKNQAIGYMKNQESLTKKLSKQ